MCAEGSVNFDIVFQGWKAGRKSGEGFILEKFTGYGTLVIAGAGNFIELNPAKYGGKIQVDTGCVVAFQDSITYEMKWVSGLEQRRRSCRRDVRRVRPRAWPRSRVTAR